MKDAFLNKPSQMLTQNPLTRQPRPALNRHLFLSVWWKNWYTDLRDPRANEAQNGRPPAGIWVLR